MKLKLICNYLINSLVRITILRMKVENMQGCVRFVKPFMRDGKEFFVLRNVKIDDLISETISKKAQTLLGKSKIKSRRVIEDTDLSGIFGIEMEAEVKK